LIKRIKDWRFLGVARRLLRFRERQGMPFFPIFGEAAGQGRVANDGRSHPFPKSDNLQLPLADRDFNPLKLWSASGKADN
jgi:hypothetical protein